MGNDKINLSEAKLSDGMKVPEGFFEDFEKRMADQLPERTDLAVVDVPRTTWQRVRPYVYMAAMFMGIWCMLKMFTLMTTTTPHTLETSPIMAEALKDESFVNDYIISELNQWDIYDELMADSITPEMLCDTLIFN